MCTDCKDCKGHSHFSGKSAGLLLIRIAVAAVFIYHGWSKFMFMDDTIAFFGTLGLAPFFAYLVAAVELIGGALLLVGAFTCIAGISLAAVMVVAVILVKAKMGFVASEPDILLFASALGIALAGGGRYSVMRHCGCPWCKKMRGGACCNSSEGCKDCVCKDGVCALPKSEEKPAEKVM